MSDMTDTTPAASAFFIAQALTAPLYGIVSDRIGRKPVLLFGLLGSAVCTIIYGTSSTLTTAIVSRALCGLFNGTCNESHPSCMLKLARLTLFLINQVTLAFRERQWESSQLITASTKAVHSPSLDYARPWGLCSGHS